MRRLAFCDLTRFGLEWRPAARHEFAGTVRGYRGRARTASASLEYRAVRWLGIGAAYDDFHLDVDSTRADLRGALSMTIRGPEVFVRVGF